MFLLKTRDDCLLELLQFTFQLGVKSERQGVKLSSKPAAVSAQQRTEQHGESDLNAESIRVPKASRFHQDPTEPARLAVHSVISQGISARNETALRADSRGKVRRVLSNLAG